MPADKNTQGSGDRRGAHSLQVRNNWPGLAREAEDICEQLGIQNVNETLLSKAQFLQLVDTAVLKKEEQLLKLSI